VWTAIWEYIEPLIEQVWQGTPIYRDNDLLSFHRFGPDGNFLERYHTWRYIPIIGNEGKVLGIFNQSIETTKQVLAERRMATVRELSEHMLVARSTKEYYSSVGEVLSQNAYDAPFALCYSVQQRETENTQVTVDVKLETSVGVPDNHPSAPGGFTLSLPARNRSAFGPNADRMSSPTLSAISALSSGSGRIYHSAEGSSWPISKALASRQCVIVDDCRDLIKGFPLRQWDKLPSAAIVVPICSDSSIDTPEAVLVLGLNSRRPFDADYDNWVHVIRAHLASSLTSVKAYEVESKRLEDNARMEKAKAAWFRGAAHDLRSPLALISGPLDDALDTVLNSDQRNSLVTAKRNVDRLMRLVNALMDFSRLEAGRVEGRFVPIDLGSFVSELAAVFRPAVERMEIQYIVEVAPSDKLVFIDPTLFETVVSNLIGNALKYTESGSITVRLTYGDFAEVAVIDTGVGIPKDELSSVSEWFHRATTAIHSGTQGTGLGLALAKELLHLHGGELLVSSQTAAESGGGHGSVFTARIPLTPKVITTAPDTSASFGAYGKVVANEAMRWVRDPDIDSMTDSTSDSHAGPASRLSEGLMFEKSDVIILADDNIDMRDYIKQIFSPYCKVIEAKNGEDALAIATENPPNLIISDLMMPKMNGIELLAAIRQDERTKIVPFVMISAVTGDDARVDALIMGAEDYLPKPFKPKELLARVHLHMQVGKKRAKLEKLYAEREVEIALLSDYCPSGIMRANAEGIITYVNKAWRTAANMTPHEEPNSWVEHVDEETLKRMLALWAEFVRGDQKELRLEWKWSSGRTMAGMFVRLDLISPGMTGILGCLNDITYEEEKIFEAERRRLEAEESRHQQELLIDLTSHEIRTPVSAILQCSSLVKENLVALTDHLKWAGAAGFKPTKELLADLDEDIEALESMTNPSRSADIRHLPMWSRTGTHRRGRPLSRPDPTRHAQSARYRNGCAKRGQEGSRGVC
jgi:signal transduction histidine kinase/DNA-binding NarL/FixJ family response regulator